MIRRGAYSNTQYHIKETYKLKEYFDDQLGYNLYDLFPEIKENLQKKRESYVRNTRRIQKKYYKQI